MAKGGKKNRQEFERPGKAKLKVKIKKAAAKKSRKAKKKSTVKSGMEAKKKSVKKIRKNSRAPKTTPESNINNDFEGRVLSEKIERSKEVIMWSGVVFFMLLIAFFWLYNTSRTFRQLQAENDNQASESDWQEMTKEIEEKINEFKEDFEEIKNTKESLDGQSGLPQSDEAGKSELFASSTTPITASTTIDNELKEEKIEQLKRMLEEEL